MKKLLIKTAFITLGVTIVLAVAVFGILSFAAPAQMMRLAFSLGLDRAGADYAYREYERSGDVGYLARSFEVYAVNGYNDGTADGRFELLYTDNAAAFGELCALRNEQIADSVENADVRYDYRDYVVGLGACVKYRLSAGDAALALALSETDSAFPAGNPVIALAVEAAGRQDGAFCARLLAAMQAGNFQQTADYMNIATILEGIANE